MEEAAEDQARRENARVGEVDDGYGIQREASPGKGGKELGSVARKDIDQWVGQQSQGFSMPSSNFPEVKRAGFSSPAIMGKALASIIF